MRKLLMTTAAVLALGTSSAFAEITTQEIINANLGALKIEIYRGDTTTKVEVIMPDGQKTQTVYDNVTNAVISTETKMLSDEDLADLLADIEEDRCEDEADAAGLDDDHCDLDDDEDDDDDEDEDDEDEDEDEDEDDEDDDDSDED